MANLKDKKFVANKALEHAAANEESSFGEHEIFSTFEADVTSTYNKSLKTLTKIVEQAKSLYDRIFMPAMERVEEVEMNNTLKSYILQDQQLENQEVEGVNRKRFAANKCRLEGVEEIKGNYFPYIFSWGFIVLFILMESGLNSQLLVKASEGGLIGGAIYAGAISTISVVFSLLCGMGFQRLYDHAGYTETIDRILASLVLIFWLFCSIVAHLSIGWYRFALREHPDEASTKWFELFYENLYRQHDFWAWALTIAGLVLATKAFHIGTKWAKASLLKKLRTAERNHEKNKTARIEWRKDAKEDLTRIKDEIIDKDVRFIIKTTSDLTSSFDLKRIEMLQVSRNMNECVESNGRNISEYIDIWRANYSSQNPDVEFFSDIPKINRDHYSLDTHPAMEWIMSINNDNIQLAVAQMREERIKQIIETYEKMCERLNSHIKEDTRFPLLEDKRRQV